MKISQAPKYSLLVGKTSTTDLLTVFGNKRALPVCLNNTLFWYLDIPAKDAQTSRYDLINYLIIRYKFTFSSIKSLILKYITDENQDDLILNIFSRYKLDINDIKFITEKYYSMLHIKCERYTFKYIFINYKDDAQILEYLLSTCPLLIYKYDLLKEIKDNPKYNDYEQIFLRQLDQMQQMFCI